MANNKRIKTMKEKVQFAKTMKEVAVKHNKDLFTDSVLEKYTAQCNEGYWVGTLSAYEEMLGFELDYAEDEFEVRTEFEKIIAYNY